MLLKHKFRELKKVRKYASYQYNAPFEGSFIFPCSAHRMVYDADKGSFALYNARYSRIVHCKLKKVSARNSAGAHYIRVFSIVNKLFDRLSEILAETTLKPVEEIDSQAFLIAFIHNSLGSQLAV